MCEPSKRLGCWSRGLVLAAGWLVGDWRANAGELSVTLLGPAAAVSSGTEIPITLNVLNPSTLALNWTFPDPLNARLRWAGKETPVRLNLANTTAPAAIAPGSFTRAEYKLRLPSGVEGDAVLEAEEFPGSAAVLRIQPPRAAAGETQAAKPAPTSESSKAAEPPPAGTFEFDPIDYFKRHLFPHEPFYFVAGPDSPNAKFQFSFKYQLIDGRSGLAKQVGFATNFFFGFTQTSLWDWNQPSAPFEDSSYKPELMFQFSRLARAGQDDWFRLDLQTGAMHESNGRDGENSRSLNIAYVRPKLILGRTDDWQFTLAPRAWVYVGDLSDNEDLADYRGHADFRATVGVPGGLELAALVRAGDDFSRGSLQLDLTFPLRHLRWTGFTWYLQAQYFTGYGESLLHYDERSTAYRFGFSIYR